MLVAGNWKMHTDLARATALAAEVAAAAGGAGGVDVAVCPPFVSLEAVGNVLEGTAVRLGAQNVHENDEGAYTGEVSAPMLVSVGCHYVIVGHSERRQLFGETDEDVNQKTLTALRHGLVPIVCVGETLEEREDDRAKSVVSRQVMEALEWAEVDAADRLVVAYEPVWAIGTGKTATPAQAQEMHAMIRDRLEQTLGPLGREIDILYGGSVKPNNAAELFAQPDIDGGLIGGASLDVEALLAIVGAAR
ncbi:MAG: triose-phosphate isomerase [Rhodothermales bacterium]|nr:triose-phosphate isomerase [Rhodothermales bacterium]